LNQKMPLVNCQVYCFLPLNFLTLQTDGIDSVLCPRFAFTTSPPEFYTGIPHTVDMWLVFLHWLSFRWPSKNRIAAVTIGQLTFHDMDMDATR
jgi:hypothetical protein